MYEDSFGNRRRPSLRGQELASDADFHVLPMDLTFTELQLEPGHRLNPIFVDSDDDSEDTIVQPRYDD